MFRALERTRTRYTECCKITRTDGVIFRFTAHDKELLITEKDGSRHTYTPANSFALTALEVSNGLAVSNMDIDGIIDDDSITEADLQNGLFDNARVDIFLAYWSNNKIGILPLRASWIGELSVEGAKFKADLRGISQRLAQVFTKKTQLDCRWQLGDENCGFNLGSPGGAHIRDYTVTSAIGRDQFTCNGITGVPNNFFQWGTAEFLTGDNAGFTMEVWRHYQTKLQLFLPLPKPIVAGDTVRLTRGCNKTYSTCCSAFGNARRFGGEPFLAGGDMLTRYPDSRRFTGEDTE
jgi:uncharacterized phage protein (TIGR02218 family)